MIGFALSRVILKIEANRNFPSVIFKMGVSKAVNSALLLELLN